MSWKNFEEVDLAVDTRELPEAAGKSAAEVERHVDAKAAIVVVGAGVIGSEYASIFAELGVDDPLLEVAKRLEEVALEDSYFVEKKLYPNVDFYSAIV